MKVLNQKGNISIILAVMTAGLFGFTAFAVDIGSAYIERVKMSNALDSAALAGAMELPDDRQGALLKVEEYLNSNETNIEEVSVTIGQDSKSIEVTGVRNVDNTFADILGIDMSQVHANTKVIIGPVKSVKGGIRPFAVEDHDYSYGDLVTLKEGAEDGYHGNYGVVALGGTGASNFEHNALYGYDGTLEIGDEIDTEPGNMAGVVNTIRNYINTDLSTYNNFERDSKRIWTIPLIDSFELDGRDFVTVVGFAQFFVEDIKKKSGKAEIEGRFIRYVANGEIDLDVEDKGTYGVKIVN